jgi:uncharacterized membrane protein
MHYQTKIMPQWLRFVLIIVIILSIFFRLSNIDRKVYWHDEVFTSLVISGYTLAEVNQEIDNGAVINAQDLQKYQHSNPERGVIKTVSSLAIDEAQLPPLYFVMVKLWVNLFGNSITTIRSLSVILGLLILPGIYWLCLELFESSTVAWIAVALIAGSPFQVLCGQEARMYSLHALNIVLSSASLLKATRLPTKLNWLIYVATIILGIYTHLLFSLVLAVHGFYVLINYGLKSRKIFLAYLISSLVSLLFFVPWLIVMTIRIPIINSKLNWLTETTPLFKIIINWVINFSRTLVDLKSNTNLEQPVDYIYWLIVSGLSLLLLMYAVYYLYRNSSKKEFYFILLLMVVPALSLAVPDLLLGGSRSTHIRYAIATYLGCNLAFAYLFAMNIVVNRNKLDKKQQSLWSFLLMIVISLGLISSVVNLQQYSWWNKYLSSDNLPISRVINSERSSIVICTECTMGMGFGNLVSLSYHLNNQVKIQLFKQLDLAKIPENFEHVFVFNPSPALQEEIQSKSNLKLENLYQNNLSLWQLKQ